MNFNNQNNTVEAVPIKEIPNVKKSVVDVYFADRDLTCTYFNDMFNLEIGDFVYVEGKLEGKRGRVVDINYNFKIKLSDYKRVIGVADTCVAGEFHQAGSHFVTTDSNALPYKKVLTWFKAPVSDEEEYVSSSSDENFNLSELGKMNIKPENAECGHEYYMENRVIYIELNAGKGKAIVAGHHNYEVEFNYDNENISGLVCNCYCAGNCKHEFATMLQLRDIINVIKKQYPHVDHNNYVVAISKVKFFEFVIDGKDSGSFRMG